MRFGTPRLDRIGLAALTVLGAILALPGTRAFGQVPQPRIPDISGAQRSDLAVHQDRTATCRPTPAGIPGTTPMGRPPARPPPEQHQEGGSAATR